MGEFFGKKQINKTRHKILHRRDKSRFKGQGCVILYIILSFKFPLYKFLQVFKKICKTRFYQNLLAVHAYPLVGLISPGTSIESTLKVDDFNDDASIYVVPTHGY